MVALLYFLLFLLNTTLQSLYIFGGDSAEFALTATTWSIPHPPGYPFYSLIINIISKIPLFSTPWRVALVSNAGAVITAFFVYKLLTLQSVSKVIAFLSGLLFMILFPVWHYSLIPEVFTINTALVAATTYCLFNFRKSNNIRYVYIATLLIGLSVAHHHTFVLFIPGWIFIGKSLLSKIPRVEYIKLLLFMLIGAAFYLYAPIASHFNPPLDWENAKTIDGLIRLFFRTAYGTFNAYSNSQSTFLSHAYDFIAVFLFIIQDFKIPGILLFALAFIYRSKIENIAHTWGFVLVSFISHIIFLTYTNFVLTVPFTTAMYERFLISLYLILVLVAGLAIQATMLAHRRFKIIFIVFYTVYVCVVGIVNSRTISQIRHLTTFDRVARDMLATVPRDGILYTGTDNTNFPLQYYLYGRKERKDVLFLHINHLNKKHEVDRLLKDGRFTGISSKEKITAKELELLLAKNEDKGIYMEQPLPVGYWMPVGLLWKYYSTEHRATADIPNLLRLNKNLWDTVYQIPVLTLEQKNFLHVQVIQDIYREALKENSKLFFIAKDYPYSFTLLERAHMLGQSNKDEKASLINIASHAKLCDLGKKYYYQLQASNDNPDVIIKSMRNFEKTCVTK